MKARNWPMQISMLLDCCPMKLALLALLAWRGSVAKMHLPLWTPLASVHRPTHL